MNKFLVWHKKIGPAQNILWPVKGQGINQYLNQNSSFRIVNHYIKEWNMCQMWKIRYRIKRRTDLEVWKSTYQLGSLVQIISTMFPKCFGNICINYQKLWIIQSTTKLFLQVLASKISKIKISFVFPKLYFDYWNFSATSPIPASTIPICSTPEQQSKCWGGWVWWICWSKHRWFQTSFISGKNIY